MKIGYIIIEPFESPGVAKKVSSKIDALSRHFENVTCYSFSFSFNDKFVSEASSHFKFFKLSRIETPQFFHRRFIYRFQYFYYYKKLYEQIYEFLKNEKNDVYIFRYPGADLGLLWLTRKFKNKIIFEHNTIEVDEMMINAHMFLNNYFVRSEKYLTPFIHSYSKGIIGVTSEIAEYHAKRSFIKKKFCTITNAINVSSFDLRQKLNFDRKTINIVTVIGSGVKDWYGLDRFFNSLKNYKGVYDFRLYIVGEGFDTEMAYSRKLGLENVYFLGKKSSDELNEIYQEMHVGMSALCLFRKNLKQAATLKVREYGLVGLPMFYAYTEVGFDKCERFNEFFLQFPNDESLIDLDKIGDFVTRFYSDKDNPALLRKFFVSEFNYDKKAVEIKEFIESI